jgi:hypothetical protein
MKKFFNLYSAVMLFIFIVGLVLSAMSQNWSAFTWIITGILWFLMARFHETSKQELTEEYEGKIAELRAVRDDYMKQYKTCSDKYEAKLKENYDLACENKRLAEDNERLAKLNLQLSDAGTTVGQKDEPVTQHGNIKIRRKKSKTE